MKLNKRLVVGHKTPKGIAKKHIQCMVTIPRKKGIKQMGNVKINAEALKKAFREAGRTYTEADRVLGFSQNHVSCCAYSGSMKADELDRICMLLNVKPDSVKAAEQEAPKAEKKADDVTQAMYDVAQIDLDDVKEVGKICDSIQREVRVTRDAMAEALVKLQAEQHEILTVLRNMQASNRELLTAIHNDLKQKK